MIHYRSGKPAGLTFHEWVEVFIDAEDGDTLDDFNADKLRVYE